MFCTKHESSCVKFNKQIFDWMYQSSSGNKTKHTYGYMNSKIRNALLIMIIMNDQSFVLSANSVYVRVHVYCSREYDVINDFCWYEYIYSSGISVISHIASKLISHRSFLNICLRSEIIPKLIVNQTKSINKSACNYKRQLQFQILENTLKNVTKSV